MNQNVYWPMIITEVLRVMDFLRSQVVRNTIKVVISRKRCKTEMLLLQTTNRK